MTKPTSGVKIQTRITRDFLFQSRAQRERFFDEISHSVAKSHLFSAAKASLVVPPRWLSYYGASVLLPEQVDSFYGVPPKSCDRIIRYARAELIDDGLIQCNSYRIADCEESLGICSIASPNSLILLPARAVLKLALFLPATSNVLAALDALGDVDWVTPILHHELPEKVRMSQHFRDREKRLSDKDREVLKLVAKEKGIFAYSHHFGNSVSGATWQRLATHHADCGQFPPTREQLNRILSL